ncbi:hypothetical protein DQ238_07620 [Geodermatophilus sp. TF02-6]|uniref:hypothetical protein n=1 Tax=Geodermatophilus sp. TF02-6 TaxID=2250575 RepID=UPI000DEBA6DC|nr:hypothetical protein [Geodermatophilus sp. TF02-6]RBY80900.1 hypothetical protein DQ238_07620 [Geodermatophilus sp. TF02-6]
MRATALLAESSNDDAVMQLRDLLNDKDLAVIKAAAGTLVVKWGVKGLGIVLEALANADDQVSAHLLDTLNELWFEGVDVPAMCKTIMTGKSTVASASAQDVLSELGAT